MGAFEHVMVLLSFVYALAIAHLLTTAARLIGSGERVRFSWLHAYWMFNALIVLVIDWISYWDVHGLTDWTILSIFIVMFQSFLDFLQAALVCPEIPAEGAIDLKEFHRKRSRRYIGAFAATVGMALLTNIYFGGTFNVAEYIRQNIVVLPLFVTALAATIFRDRRVQIAAPFVLLALWAYYLVALQDALR